MFKVCQDRCTAGSIYCRPLRSLTVALAPAVLANPSKYIVSATPTGTLTSAGWVLSGSELGALATADPSVVSGAAAASCACAFLPTCLLTGLDTHACTCCELPDSHHCQPCSPLA